ncbi:MAG: hypothetical protein MJ229_06790 [bacterium]|nr:hypothetical protein [bacterium]
MRKYLFILISAILLTLPTFAAEGDIDFTSGDLNDLLKYTNRFDIPFANQKQITDEEYEKTINELKAKQNKKLKKEERPLEGKSIKDDNETTYIQETGEKYIILNLPVEVTTQDGTDIPIGFYRMIATKEGKDLYLEFFQSSKKIARVKAIETNYDFDEKEVNFVKVIPCNESIVRLIYGSIDYNAYAYLRLKN